jgi:Alpha/beta hydrolase domain
MGANQSISRARVPNPTVILATGGSGHPLGGLAYDVSQFGYKEKELYFSGTAKTYPPTIPSTSPYRSRMIVWTPKNPARYNGTTVVEWAEVSDAASYELTVELNYESQMLIDQGYAFVLVSTQQGGVCGRNPATGLCSPMSLVGADPARYGSLNIPKDHYSFDIFSQALQAIKHPVGTAPLGTLKTRVLIAEGFQESVDKYFVNMPTVPLSSTRPLGDYGPLNAYIDSGADADARLADAFLIDGAAPPNPPPRYRVPTLHYLDESAVRWTTTPDSRNHVTWEVTGAAHVDGWEVSQIRLPSSDPGPLLTAKQELVLRAKNQNYGQEPDPGGSVCAPGPRTGSLYPRRFTLDAALSDLREWVRTGQRAPTAPRIKRVSSLPSAAEGRLQRDQYGTAIGGLRSPIIEVPVATYDGNACIESGTTTKFSAALLKRLYPTHKSYVSKMFVATNRAVTERYLDCEDATTLMMEASASTIGGSDKYGRSPSCAR